MTIEISEAAGAAIPIGVRLPEVTRLISQVTGILTAKVATIEWAKQTIDRRLAFRYAFMQNTKLTRMQSIE